MARRINKKNIDQNQNVVKDEFERPKIEFIIEQLINNESKYTDKELRDQLLTLVVTASDTTMNLVLAAIMYISIYPEIQQKVFDEICEIFGDDSDDLDYERLSSLKYLEMVLKETLRLFGPLPITTREPVEDCDIGTGKPVRKGTKIFIFSYVLHQRKDIWGPDATEFDPENFSPEKVLDRDPYSFTPFGMVSASLKC